MRGPVSSCCFTFPSPAALPRRRIVATGPLHRCTCAGRDRIALAARTSGRSPLGRMWSRVEMLSIPARCAGVLAAAVLLCAQGLYAPRVSVALAEAPRGALLANEAEGEVQDEAQLLDMSRRNSRVTGHASQTFAAARRAAASGDLPGALSQYKELLEEAPSFAPGWSNRANILVAQNRLEAAISDYSKALELAPLASDNWVILVNRGSTYLALGDTQLALNDINAALTKSGVSKASVYSNRAACYEALGKWDAALRDYQRAIEAKASDVQPWWLRYAMVLYERGRLTESVGIMRRVAARYDVDDVHAALAGVLFSRGDIAEAEGQWSLVSRPRQFSNPRFLEERKWTPKMVKAMEEYSAGRKPALTPEAQS